MSRSRTTGPRGDVDEAPQGASRAAGVSAGMGAEAHLSVGAGVGGGVESLTMSTVETTHSTLFFLSDRVYKMPKRSVVGRRDLRRREARAEACRAEVVRNRPFAPGVYLGVADVRDSDGVPLEHMVVMRRLPSERRLSELLAHGEPVEEPLRETARALVTFHEQCETSASQAQGHGQGRLRELEAAWLEAMEAVAPFGGTTLDAGELDEIDRLGQRYLRGRRRLFEARAARGHVRDGHGNLRAEHVFCLPEGPRILDRLPAEGGRRIADVLADAAVLAVDLELGGAPDLGRRFLDWYGEFSGETHSPSLVHFYTACKAVVLAGDAAVRSRLGDETAARQGRRLTRLAVEHLRQARVRLVLVGGTPGPRRAALGVRLAADEDGWALLSADAVRGELVVAGDLAGDRAAADDASRAAADDAVYAELLRRAREALEYGESVLVEASWPAGARRGAAVAVADETWADLIEIDCSDPDASAEELFRVGRLAAGVAG